MPAGRQSAKLPPPTPEEQAKAAADKEREQAQLQREKAALERAQDRVAAHYSKDKNPTPNRPYEAGGWTSAGSTADENMPKTTQELPRGVGPKPHAPQTGEAHSASAK